MNECRHLCHFVYKYRLSNNNLSLFSFIYREIIPMKSRIRGSLFGVLIGDCNGAIFEESSCLEGGARKLLTTYFNKLELEVPKGKYQMNLISYEKIERMVLLNQSKVPKRRTQTIPLCQLLLLRH